MARPRGTNRLAGWLMMAAALVLLDQLSKFAILHSLRFSQRLPVISGVFDRTLVYNTGAAFSFLAGAGGWQRWLFTGIGAAAAGFIGWLLWRHGSQKLFAFSLTLILAGALGNLIDRIRLGKVVDFLLVYHHPWYFPAFNLADSAITVGAALLIIDELRRVRRSRG